MKTQNKILTLFGLLGISVACCFSTNKAIDLENKENVQQCDVHPNIESIKNFLALEHPVKMPKDLLRESHVRSVEKQIKDFKIAVFDRLWHCSEDGLNGVIDSFFDACTGNNFTEKLVITALFRRIANMPWLLDELQHTSDACGEVPLVYAFNEYGEHKNFHEIFVLMIECGFSIDVYDTNGDTLLDLCFKGHCANVEIKQYLAQNLTTLVNVKKGGRRG